MLEATRPRWSTTATPRWPDGSSSYDASQRDRIVRYKIFAYDGLIDQARAAVAWAERGLVLVDELEGSTVD